MVEAYQAVLKVGNRHIRSMGLTPAQLDGLAELGGTNGMTAVELSLSYVVGKSQSYRNH